MKYGTQSEDWLSNNVAILGAIRAASSILKVEPLYFGWLGDHASCAQCLLLARD